MFSFNRRTTHTIYIFLKSLIYFPFNLWINKWIIISVFRWFVACFRKKYKEEEKKRHYNLSFRLNKKCSAISDYKEELSWNIIYMCIHIFILGANKNRTEQNKQYSYKNNHNSVQWFEYLRRFCVRPFLFISHWQKIVGWIRTKKKDFDSRNSCGKVNILLFFVALYNPDPCGKRSTAYGHGNVIHQVWKTETKNEIIKYI